MYLISTKTYLTCSRHNLWAQWLFFCTFSALIRKKYGLGMYSLQSLLMYYYNLNEQILLDKEWEGGITVI